MKTWWRRTPWTWLWWLCAVLFIPVVWLIALDHIASRVLDHTVLQESGMPVQPAGTPKPAATPLPASFFHAGEWRRIAYGEANCVWIAAHMQRGKWMEGYWRRKPHLAEGKAP